MTVSLTTEMEQLVQEQVASGRYASPAEVLREALQLLSERDGARWKQFIALKQDITVGVEQSLRDEVMDAEELFEQLLREVPGASQDASDR